KRGEDTSCVKPASAILTKNFFPIDIAGLKLRYRSVPAIVRSYSGAHAEAPLGEVESVAGGVADAIVLNPAHERLINAALINQILEQTADRITGEGGDDGAFHTEAAHQPTHDVVLSAFALYFYCCRYRP